MSHRDSVFMFAVLLCVCGALLYLDWRRQGEIDNLHARLDAFERRAHTGGAAAGGTAADETVVRSTVERILHASDDRTLADIAREGA